jgi:hypothetical protein
MKAFGDREVSKEIKSLKNDFLQLDYLTSALRITGLTPAGRTNLLADMNTSPPISTSYGDFYFQGGHRLWHAPEALPRTYIPDQKLTIKNLPDGVLLEAQTEPATGIRKQMEIRLAEDKPTVTLTHTLINDGLWTVELAPWAITQFRLGGTVVLPMPVGNTDPAGLLHNRQFSFWPYARINDPRLKLNDHFVFFKAQALLPPFKLGYFNKHGWLSYYLDGIVFRKLFDVQASLPHPDNNCNAEMYCNDQFVELESLGPVMMLPPGGSVVHTETWEIATSVESLPEEVKQELILE